MPRTKEETRKRIIICLSLGVILLIIYLFIYGFNYTLFDENPNNVLSTKLVIESIITAILGVSLLSSITLIPAVDKFLQSKRRKRKEKR